MRIWQVCILSELLKGVQSVTFPDIGPISGQNVTFLKTHEIYLIYLFLLFFRPTQPLDFLKLLYAYDR